MKRKTKRTSGHAKRMAYLRAKLLERRKEHHKELRRELAVPWAELAPHPGDISDAAVDASAREVAGYLAELEATELDQIDEALAKIRKGTYGICEVCGDRIGAARLKAVPNASLCLRCKQREEKEAISQSEPYRWRHVVDQRSDVFDPDAMRRVVRGRKLA